MASSCDVSVVCKAIVCGPFDSLVVSSAYVQPELGGTWGYALATSGRALCERVAGDAFESG